MLETKAESEQCILNLANTVRGETWDTIKNMIINNKLESKISE
jgi:hypothetical protein